jgi:gluconate kinase
MSPSLLGSQFQTLERPAADEPVFTVSVAESEEKALRAIQELVDRLRSE